MNSERIEIVFINSRLNAKYLKHETWERLAFKLDRPWKKLYLDAQLVEDPAYPGTHNKFLMATPWSMPPYLRCHGRG